MRKRDFGLMFVLFQLLIGMPSASWAVPVFLDDFSSGLSALKWDTSLVDGVSVENDMLALRDSEYNTFLFGLPVSLAAGNYRFSFDYKAGLANSSSGNTLVYDLFTASLTTDTLLEVTKQEAIPYGGQLQQAGDGWSHLTYDFTLGLPADMFIWFTLRDNTYVIGDTFQPDSTVFIDNLLIADQSQVVPEPSTLALVGIVFAAAILIRMRKAVIQA